MALTKVDLNMAREIKELLEKNYRDHYTYDELVSMYGTNKLKLKLAFKAITGDNIYEYLTKIRIEQAKLLLENTEHTIERIAGEVGLDIRNLEKQFKKSTGKTPTEWRNQSGSNGDFPLGRTGC